VYHPSRPKIGVRIAADTMPVMSESYLCKIIGTGAITRHVTRSKMVIMETITMVIVKIITTVTVKITTTVIEVKVAEAL
jgi:hypothetical protein